MLATHWINWQINTPYELKNRQQQMTGTCWINSIINSFILVPEIKKAMIEKIESSGYSSRELPTLNELINEDGYSLKDVIFTFYKSKLLIVLLSGRLFGSSVEGASGVDAGSRVG